jgi:hypothetical protein
MGRAIVLVVLRPLSPHRLIEVSGDLALTLVVEVLIDHGRLLEGLAPAHQRALEPGARACILGRTPATRPIRPPPWPRRVTLPPGEDRLRVVQRVQRQGTGQRAASLPADEFRRIFDQVTVALPIPPWHRHECRMSRAPRLNGTHEAYRRHLPVGSPPAPCETPRSASRRFLVVLSFALPRVAEVPIDQRCLPRGLWDEITVPLIRMAVTGASLVSALTRQLVQCPHAWISI